MHIIYARYEITSKVTWRQKSVIMVSKVHLQ